MKEKLSLFSKTVIFASSQGRHLLTLKLEAFLCSFVPQQLKHRNCCIKSIIQGIKIIRTTLKKWFVFQFQTNKDECLGIQPSRIMVITSLRHKGWARGNLDGHLICTWFVSSSYLQLSASQKDNLNHHYDGYSSRLLNGHTWNMPLICLIFLPTGSRGVKDNHKWWVLPSVSLFKGEPEAGGEAGVLRKSRTPSLPKFGPQKEWGGWGMPPKVAISTHI